MSQSVVTIRLNGNPYQIGCGAGEEAHVSKLGEEVESIMQSLIASVGQIGEARLLAMVALILADRAAGNADEPRLNGAADGAGGVVGRVVLRVRPRPTMIRQPRRLKWRQNVSRHLHPA